MSAPNCMTKTLIDYNHMTGLHVWHEYNEADDATIISYTSDAAPVLDQNKREANDQYGRMGDMQKVASIPVGVMYEWLTKYGVRWWDKNHAPAVKRLLNSSDYRWCRTREIIL